MGHPLAAQKWGGGFFRISPGTIQLNSVGAALQALYTDRYTGLAEDPLINLTDQIQRAIQHIYQDPDSPEINQDLYEFYRERLQRAVDEGYGEAVFSSDQAKYENKFSLKNNVALFAGLKAYHEKSDMARVMKNPDGSLRSFKDFRKDALKINQKYRVQWLKAEYDITQRSAAMASKWQDMWSKRDFLPYLEYIPSRSVDPREEHRKYYGLVKPIDDPIWQRIMPPNGWGCKCSVRQTASVPSGAITEVPSGVPVDRGLTGNAGSTGRVFTDRHAYAQAPKQVRSEIERAEVRRLHSEIKKMNTAGKLDLTLPDGTKVFVTNKGISKFLGQKIDDFEARFTQRRLLLVLPEIITNAEYVTSRPNVKPEAKPHAKAYHYYRVNFEGKEFYLNVEEAHSKSGPGLMKLYTITDKIKPEE